MIALLVHAVLLTKLRIHVVARHSCARFCFRCVFHKVGPLEEKTPKQPLCPPPPLSLCPPNEQTYTVFARGQTLGV